MKRLPYVFALICSLSAPSLSASEGDEALDRAYIEGFLAGAQLTDREIISRLDDFNPEEKYSDFFKRAFKTRIGSAKDDVPATFYAGFCLPENNITNDVIARILKQVNHSPETSGEEKAARVFKAVRTQYPCP